MFELMCLQISYRIYCCLIYLTETQILLAITCFYIILLPPSSLHQEYLTSNDKGLFFFATFVQVQRKGTDVLLYLLEQKHVTRQSSKQMYINVRLWFVAQSVYSILWPQSAVVIIN